MKTASEIVSLIMDQYVDSQQAEDLIKEYAKDLVNQALHEASESAYIFSEGYAELDKQSILDVEIEFP